MSSGCELGRNLVRGALWEQNGTMFEEGQAGVRGGDRIRDTVRGSAGHLEALVRALPGSNRANPAEKPLSRAGAPAPICHQVEGNGLCPPPNHGQGSHTREQRGRAQTSPPGHKCEAMSVGMAGILPTSSHRSGRAGAAPPGGTRATPKWATLAF